MVPTARKIHFYHQRVQVPDVTSYSLGQEMGAGLPICQVHSMTAGVERVIVGTVVNIVSDKNVLVFELE